MNNLKSLKGNILKSRIDGANFTALIPFNPNDFSERVIKINNLENSTDNYNFQTLINFYKNRILKTFNLNEGHINNTPNGIQINATQDLGIYCDLKRKKYDLYIHIQFKGFFFINKNSLYKLRLYMIELIKNTKEFFRLTLIDIAKDITLKPNEILPYDSNIIKNNHFYYSFNHKKTNYTDQNSKEQIETGFKLYNSRFAIKVYDKRYENSQHKNQIKKEYYEKFFAKFVDKNNNPLPVSRVELTIKQESCKKYSDHILNFDIPEEKIINDILSSFGSNHSLRQKAPNSQDKNKKRWPKVKNWIDLFSSNSEIELQDSTLSDYRFSNPKINIEKLLEKLVEAFAFKNEYDLETLKKEDIIRILEPKIDVILKDAKTKRYEHERTIRQHEEHIRKIVKRASNDQLSLFVGDFL